MKRIQVQAGIWLDARRAVFFDALGVLALADLHWGYAASHRAAGNLLPLWGDDVIAQTLDALIADYQPKEMIWLGDSLHAVSGRRAAEEFLARSAVPTVLIAGNHDRKWKVAAEAKVERPGFLFHHGDGAFAVPEGAVEVVGHHHPAFNWEDGAGTRLKLPSLVRGPRRMILPAFSPWAAGVPWNQHLLEEEELWVIAPKRIFPVTVTLLRQSRG